MSQEIVSVSTAGDPANWGATFSTVSADGRYVVFDSAATNLDAGGGILPIMRIYLHDRFDGETTVLINRFPNTASTPIFSDNGQFLVYSGPIMSGSVLTGNYVSRTDVFLYDLTTKKVTTVNLTDGDKPSASLSMAEPAAVSDDGRYILFRSSDATLTSGDTNGDPDYYIRDTKLGTTKMVSVYNGQQAANGVGIDDRPDMSSDGRYVAFEAGFPGTGANAVYLHDSQTGTTQLVSKNASNAAVHAEHASISGDGRFLVYGSSSNQLADGDGNNSWDIFVYDRVNGTTQAVSLSADGSFGNDDSQYAKISADGSCIVFVSEASNLVDGDDNGKADLFMVRWDSVSGKFGNVERIYAVTPDGLNALQTGGSANNLAISKDGSLVTNGYYNGSSNQILAIGDDYQGPSISIADATVTEGAKTVALTVSLSAAFDSPITVEWVITGDSATAGKDFVAASGKLTIAAGKSSGTITITLPDDKLPEDTETFTVTLSNALGAQIVDGTATVTINDNEIGVTTATALADIYRGDADDNSFDGLAGNDTLAGMGGNDSLTGGAGDDYLDGGEGNDALTGGAGSDVYVVDSADDVLVELANEGIDTVETVLTSFTLAENFEKLLFTGSGDATLTGNAGANSITGGSGNDRLDGLAGADLLSGGAGDDSYYVDDLKDKLVEAVNGGIDTVHSTVNFTLGAGFEHLQLEGAANLLGKGNTADNHILGNAGNNQLIGLNGNDTLDGGEGNDILDGGVGDDTLIGGDGTDSVDGGAGTDILILSGNEADYSFVMNGPNGFLVTDGNGVTEKVANIETFQFTGSNTSRSAIKKVLAGSGTIQGDLGGDTLTGSVGADTLDGREGIDKLIGGDGNDIYYVDQAKDAVVEALNQGTDTVYASSSYTLGANVEHLIVTGAVGRTATGNQLANSIIGGDGNDVLLGMAGDDTLDGGDGTDSIDGGAGNDTLILSGNEADYSFVMTGANSFLVTDGNGLTEKVANIETFQFTGSDTSRSAVKKVLAGSGTVQGDLGGDTLTGSTGADTLDGREGIDKLIGGDGNDVYHVDQTKDAVVELANQGIDTVYASSSFTLGANVEHLVITSTAGRTATGNLLANSLTGGAGNDLLFGMAGDDVLIGGLGNDTLDGGAGNDRFVFESGCGKDLIVNFAPAKAGAAAIDVIDLSAFDLDWASLQGMIEKVGADLVIKLSDDDQITLKKMGAVTLTEDHFLL